MPEPSRDHVPDPAALAQGHRLLRAAAGLEVPAWIFGSLALLLLVLQSLAFKRLAAFGVALALTLTLARMLWSSIRTPSMGATAPSPRLPGEVHDLLALVDSLIDALERGNDRLFNVDMIQLGLALDRLGPEAQRYLDERGADRARLRHGLGWSEDARGISADRRRAFHQELLRFGAAARGRPCGDPYRSRVSDGPILLAVVRDRSLARARRRCGLLLLCVAAIWASVSQMMAAMQTRGSRLCNPWGDNPYCGFELDLEVELQLLQMMLPRLDPWLVGILAVALVPMVLLVAAHVAREAGWRSFAAALPAPSELPGVPSRLLARLRRRERASRGLWRALLGLVCIATLSLLLVTHEWNRFGFTMTERVALIELVTLAVVLIPTLIGKWELGRERRRLQRRIDRAPQSAAPLTELFELRNELEHAAPARGELLEQFARTLEQAQALGRLTVQERERVVARLRAAAARGPAIDRATRELLLLELRACEAAIGARVDQPSLGRRVCLALAVFMAPGCAHLDAAHARLDPTVAGAQLGDEPRTSSTEGIVDLSEPPRVIEAPSPDRRTASRARGLHFGTLLAAPEVASWLPPDYSGPSVQIELRNNCALDFSYSFAPSMTPSADAPPRRTLAGHTLELQHIVEGHWLQLWDGDRWLGSAMTTVDRGRMDISPNCDALAISVELRDRGPTSFAIHWELDADDSLARSSESSDSALLIETQEQPEPWGPSDAEDRIELRLANLCAESIDYAFTPSFDAQPEHTASLPARSQRRVAIPARWWLRYRALNDEWRGGATTSLDGGIVWISADCVDFGVADGTTVGP